MLGGQLDVVEASASIGKVELAVQAQPGASGYRWQGSLFKEPGACGIEAALVEKSLWRNLVDLLRDNRCHWSRVIVGINLFKNAINR